jgi:excisionase family DNA binding protein
MTVREVARELNCSVTHVYNLIHAGEIVAVNIAGEGKRPSWRIPPEQVNRFKTPEKEVRHDWQE